MYSRPILVKVHIEGQKVKYLVFAFRPRSRRIGIAELFDFVLETANAAYVF